MYYYFKFNRAASAQKDKIEDAVLQFGVTVGKKHFKKAVHRNHIKRLVREVYRLQKLPLKETLLRTKQLYLKVFFIYSGKEMLNFDLAKEKVNLILQKLEKEATKKTY